MKANLKNTKKISLENPWSGSLAVAMTWKEIVAWGKDNVHENNLKEWIKEARIAFVDDDSKQLGIMIIGS